MKSSLVFLFLISALDHLLGLNNGLGTTPAMGWNTWNKYGCEISYDIIKSNADMIVQLGLNKLGYVYVNIDDCWMLKDRNASNNV